MLPDITVEKADLRAKMRALRTDMPVERRLATALAIAGHAARIAQLRPSGVVSGYVAIRGEADPAPLMQAMSSIGWTTALPRIEGVDLSFRAYNPGDPLACSGFGLTEPAPDAPRLAPDILLVPLLAFDSVGNRLGYGRGYYDRALARLPEAIPIGLAYAMQEVPHVPIEANDIPLRYILTERGWIDCRH